MKRSELTEFAVEEEGFKLKIRRGLSGAVTVPSMRESQHPFPVLSSGEIGSASASNSGQPNSPAAKPADQDAADVTYIKSPMVGTFYRSPSPESKPFAENGTKVVETTPVCIIEAMKIMNEIQAEQKGTVVEVLVENGQPVEYGQKLFRLKKA